MNKICLHTLGLILLTFLIISASGEVYNEDVKMKEESISEGDEENGLFCSTCHLVVNTVSEVLSSNLIFHLVKAIIMPICKLFTNNELCKYGGNILAPPFYKHFVQRCFNSEVICSEIHFCSSPKIVKDTNQAYQERILNDQQKELQKSKIFNNTQNGEAFKFVVVADPHIDLVYEQGKSTECKLPVCCRKGSPDAESNSTKAGKWGSLAKCDLPLRTAYNFIDYIGTEIKPDFIAWLGDNPGHNVWEQTKEDHLNSTKYMTERFLKYFPSVGQVYPLLGNHEGYPVDHFDLPSHQWLLNETAELWKPWLTDEAYESYKKIGSYSQLHPGTNLRIIAFLCFPYDDLNSYFWINSTNPLGTLDWLYETLLRSEGNNESVMILGHIAPNNAATQDWSFRYNVLVERFSHIIKAQYFGHTHKDIFSLNRAVDNSSNLTGVMQIVPSLGTYSNLNPSFRLSEIDAATYELTDYEQWRLYLDEANNSSSPIWRIAYSFQEYYEVSSMKPHQFQYIAQRMIQDEAYFKKVMTMKYCEGPDVSKEKFSNHHSYCQYNYGTFDQIIKCQKAKKTFEYFMKVHFIPKWKWAIPKDDNF